MIRCNKFLIYITCTFFSSYTQAQITTPNDWHNSDIITSLNQDTVKRTNEEVSTWENIAEANSNTDTDILPELNISQERGIRNLTIKGKQVQVPTLYNKEGIDMSLLTKDGISIHMIALQPVFYQETSDDLIKWIRFYGYKNRNYTKRIFEKYQKWEPYLQACFQKYNVPKEIAILCLIESGCSYDIKSSVGAAGMWQLMPATARELGLTLDNKKDDRTDPVLSSAAAANILVKNYTELRDWTLAIAAYNCGLNRVGKCIEKAESTLWNDVCKFLPYETQQYIPALLAIHYTWNYRKELGFLVQ